jgi:hypothetical protein
MSAGGVPAYRNNPNDLRNLAAGAAGALQFDKPWLHGALMGGLGLGLGYLARPIFRRLYPEFDSDAFPWATAALAGLPAFAISRANRPREEGLPKAAGANFSSPIHPALMYDALRPMVGSGMVSPVAGAAMGALTRAAAGPDGTATVQSYAGTANQAMRAAGAYFSPVNRIGWALAGAGAARLTGALGGDGPAADLAVRRAGPALQLMAAGLRMAGGL